MRRAMLRAAVAALLPAASASAALVAAVPRTAAAHELACSGALARTCHGAWAVGRHRHVARAMVRRRLARYGRPYHIPRFSQAEAEAEVHTVYPYRTGVYAPWPGFYGTPYDSPY